MGASFRNTGEIEALAGCDRLTIAPDLLHKLADDNGALARKLSPESAGPAPARIAMDEKRWRWMMNEDAMATEKLAEGIRVFAHDLGALRELVAKGWPRRPDLSGAGLRARLQAVSGGRRGPPHCGPPLPACLCAHNPLYARPFHRRIFAGPALRVRSGGGSSRLTDPPRFNRKGYRSGTA